MRVGISQLVMSDLSMEEFLSQSAGAGYEAVELSLRNKGPLTPETTDDELVKIAGRAAELGLSMPSMTLSHCTGNLLDSGERQRASIEQTVQGLEIARKLGIQCTLHTLGGLNADLYYDDGYRNGIAALKEIAVTCEKLDVRLAVEFVWSGFLFSPMEMRRFLDEVGSSHVGFYFDPGNMAVFQYPQHWVRIVGGKIFMVHLKDWKGNALSGGWTPLLEGEVDFAAINRELRTIRYDGPMISEVDCSDAPIENTAQAIRKIIAM